MARLLIVHHSPRPVLQAITDAVVAGASDESIEGVEVVVLSALEAGVLDVLAADGYLLGTPANFGYMSGALKHFFDTVYDDVREQTAKRPFGYWIHGRSDTTGAERSVLAITKGLGWTQAAEPLCFVGEPDDDHLDRARDLGGTLAAHLM